METIENRFKTLVQPIRDLALNWDIDIAEELSDYLEELDTLDLDSSEKFQSLNFAEAALLIQGSAAVYSKKVEYLHQLVLQALDIITSTKSGASKSNSGLSTTTTSNSGRQKPQSYLDDERVLFGTDPSYLLLDDLLEDGVNIDLVTDVEKSKKRVSIGRLSLTGDSRTSSIMMTSILQEDHVGGSLKLSSCRVDESGALVMGGVQPKSETSVFDQSLSHHNQSRMMLGNSIIHLNKSGTNLGDDNNQYGGQDDYGGVDDYGDNDNDDNYCPPMDISVHSTKKTPSKNSNSNSINNNNNEDAPISPGGIQSAMAGNIINLNDDVRALRSLRTPDSDSIQAPKNNKPPVFRNCMRLMDPHEVNASSKELRKGKTYKLPPSLTTKKVSKKSKNVSDEKSLKLKSWMIFDDIMSGNVPTTGLLHAHFQDLSAKLKKAERAKNFTQNVRGVGINGVNGHRHHAADQGEEDDDHLNQFIYKEPTHIPSHDPIVGALWNNDDDEDNGYGDYGGGDDDDGDHDFGNFGTNTSPPAIGNTNHASNNGEPQADAEYHVVSPSSSSSPTKSPFSEKKSAIAAALEEEEDWARRVEAVLNESLPVHSGESTYESLCRKHIDQFMKGAEEYARETNLSRRVSEWTKRVEPILQAQEQAGVFDIHDYSHKVLQKVDRVIQTPFSTRTASRRSSVYGNRKLEDEEAVAFDEVAQNQSSAEVCRIFLACLQLANNGNLEINPPKNENISLDNHSLEPFTMHLLNLL